MEQEIMEYTCIPFEFIRALNQVGTTKVGYELILWMLSKTSRRWIRNKTTESSGLDWIDLNLRSINRSCWGKNRTIEITRALQNLGSKDIIVYNCDIDRMRINYKTETWNIY